MTATISWLRLDERDLRTVDPILAKIKAEPAVATLLRLGDDAKPTQLAQAFVDNRYSEDEAFRLRWRWRGNADATSNSSPVFQANRMFFRTVGSLWCVGDPQLPWPTPASAPNSALDWMRVR